MVPPLTGAVSHHNNCSGAVSCHKECTGAVSRHNECTGALSHHNECSGATGGVSCHNEFTGAVNHHKECSGAVSCHNECTTSFCIRLVEISPTEASYRSLLGKLMQRDSSPLVNAYAAIEDLLKEVTAYVNMWLQFWDMESGNIHGNREKFGGVGRLFAVLLVLLNCLTESTSLHQTEFNPHIYYYY